MLWVKALHIISVIAWMAALLYLPRLMVYHADAPVGSDRSETFKVMERRLLRAIANPAMIGTWVFGLWLVWSIEAWRFGWFAGKLACVLALSAFHGMLAGHVKAFSNDRNRRPARFFRLINEIPTVLMIAVVILVVVKPF